MAQRESGSLPTLPRSRGRQATPAATSPLTAIFVAATNAPLRPPGSGGADHLHFGLLDDPDPMVGTSLPMAFDHWTLEGTVSPRCSRRRTPRRS